MSRSWPQVWPSRYTESLLTNMEATVSYRITAGADSIIPGHDNHFPMTEQILTRIPNLDEFFRLWTKFHSDLFKVFTDILTAVRISNLERREFIKSIDRARLRSNGKPIRRLSRPLEGGNERGGGSSKPKNSERDHNFIRRDTILSE